MVSANCLLYSQYRSWATLSESRGFSGRLPRALPTLPRRTTGLTANGRVRAQAWSTWWAADRAARRRPPVVGPGSWQSDEGTGPLRVLIADDSSHFPELLLHCFHNHDWIKVVGCAANGRDAVMLASAMKPDVVVTDLNMPLVDGIEATRRILALQPSAMVLVLTGSSDTDECTRALAAGARMVLPKSIDLTVVVDLLRDAYLERAAGCEQIARGI